LYACEGTVLELQGVLEMGTFLAGIICDFLALRNYDGIECSHRHIKPQRRHQGGRGGNCDGIDTMNAFRCLRVAARPASSSTTLLRPRIPTPQRYALSTLTIYLYTDTLTDCPHPRNPAKYLSSHPGAPSSLPHPHVQPYLYPAPLPHRRLSIWQERSLHTLA
jgi:hypothetical protein